MPKFVKLLLALVVLAAVAAGALWWLVLRDNSPPPPELAACEGGGVVAGDPSSTALDGSWTLVPGDGVFAGYRIGEQFGGDTFTRDAVARTAAVEGTMTVVSGELIDAEVTADLTALESEDPTASRRDRFLASNGLETDDFPEASFTLTQSAELAVPPEGACVSVEVTGDLTLHGVTRPATLALHSTWEEGHIEVAGSAPVVLDDFGIEPPDVAGLATAEDEGALELLLRFERSTGG